MLKSIGNRLRSFRFISVPLSVMRPTTENYKITNEIKFETMRKKFGPTKYPPEKILEPGNTHEIPTRKNLGPTKYPREKILVYEIPTRKIQDPRNTHEKIFGPMKYPRRHDYTMALGPRCPRWPTMASVSRNLAHSKNHMHGSKNEKQN